MKTNLWQCVRTWLGDHKSAIKTLRLSLNDLNGLVKPAFWFNDNICFYRMERILSLNSNFTLPHITDDDYYYQVVIFYCLKIIGAYLNGELSNANNLGNNASNNVGNNASNKVIMLVIIR